jgi:hypothetical protein
MGATAGAGFFAGGDGLIGGAAFRKFTNLDAKAA